MIIIGWRAIYASSSKCFANSVHVSADDQSPSSEELSTGNESQRSDDNKKTLRIRLLLTCFLTPHFFATALQIYNCVSAESYTAFNTSRGVHIPTLLLLNTPIVYSVAIFLFRRAVIPPKRNQVDFENSLFEPYPVLSEVDAHKNAVASVESYADIGTFLNEVSKNLTVNEN